MPNRIDVRGIEFETVLGEDLGFLPQDVLDEAQELDARALKASLPHLTDDEIAHATGGDDREGYYNGRRDANTQVGIRYRGGQLYAAQIQVFARRSNDGVLVGETFGANNTSGPDRQARMDATVPLHKWDWHGMIAVDPNEQGRGIARVMSAMILFQRSMMQPVSVHAWDVPHIEGIVYGGRLRPRGDAVIDHPFGEEGPGIERQWYVGRVATARLAYLQQPGAVEGYLYARRSARAAAPRWHESA